MEAWGVVALYSWGHILWVSLGFWVAYVSEGCFCDRLCRIVTKKPNPVWDCLLQHQNFTRPCISHLWPLGILKVENMPSCSLLFVFMCEVLTIFLWPNLTFDHYRVTFLLCWMLFWNGRCCHMMWFLHMSLHPFGVLFVSRSLLAGFKLHHVWTESSCFPHTRRVVATRKQRREAPQGGVTMINQSHETATKVGPYQW